jgi:hypothetical protein
MNVFQKPIIQGFEWGGSIWNECSIQKPIVERSERGGSIWMHACTKIHNSRIWERIHMMECLIQKPTIQGINLCERIQFWDQIASPK